MIPVDDPTSLSQLLHLNSEPWLNEQAYRGASYQQEFKEYREASRTLLSAVDHSGVTQLAAKRVSTRAFVKQLMPLQTLSALLHATYGVLEVSELPMSGSFLRRSVPSAGGLYPLEVYPLLHNIDGIADGIYHFDARGNALELVSSGQWQQQASKIFYTWPFLKNINAILCIAAVFKRCQSKYGPRGYRYIHLEAGQAAQNSCLRATELGLSTLCMGGFQDTALNALLALDRREEGVVYTIAVGHAENA